jgi:hypothetical protein
VVDESTGVYTANIYSGDTEDTDTEHGVNRLWQVIEDSDFWTNTITPPTNIGYKSNW